MKYLKVFQPGNIIEQSWYLKIMKEECHGFFFYFLVKYKKNHGTLFLIMKVLNCAMYYKYYQ